MQAPPEVTGGECAPRARRGGFVPGASVPNAPNFLRRVIASGTGSESAFFLRNCAKNEQTAPNLHRIRYSCTEFFLQFGTAKPPKTPPKFNGLRIKCTECTEFCPFRVKYPQNTPVAQNFTSCRKACTSYFLMCTRKSRNSVQYVCKHLNLGAFFVDLPAPNYFRDF